LSFIKYEASDEADLEATINANPLSGRKNQGKPTGRSVSSVTSGRANTLGILANVPAPLLTYTSTPLSPNNARLTEVFRGECRCHGILSRPEDVFGYMYKFETNERQMTVFEWFGD